MPSVFIEWSDIRDEIINHLSRRNLVPLIGAGLSCGAPTAQGKVPDGASFVAHMIETLQHSPSMDPEELAWLRNQDFSKICTVYEDDEHVPIDARLAYLRKNFLKAHYLDEDPRLKFFEINWPYIYSLNIDDVIENSTSFEQVILPFRELNDNALDTGKCIIKLHGDITELSNYKDAGKVFTSKEYARSLQDNGPLLNMLRDDMTFQNVLFIGCSLSSEFDLLALTDLSDKISQHRSDGRLYYFYCGDLRMTERSNLKSYGITTAVHFDNPQQMYRELYLAWQESKGNDDDEIERYAAIRGVSLQVADKTNAEYFYQAKVLFSPADRTLTYPHFLIKRFLNQKIINNLKLCTVQIVTGTHFSGLSYLLAELHRELIGHKVYYFNSLESISDVALTSLVGRKGITVLIDSGCLESSQFLSLLKRRDEIHKNGNNFVLTLKNSDRDTQGLINFALKDGELSSNSFITLDLHRKLSSNRQDHRSDSELYDINSRFTALGLLAIRSSQNFLDHLMECQEVLKVSGKYSEVRLRADHSLKELKFLLLLALRGRATSRDLIDFGIADIAATVCKKYTPFIEVGKTLSFEKSPSRNSSVKFTLNSTFWLHSQLRDFISEPKNFERLLDVFYEMVAAVNKLYDRRSERGHRLQPFIFFDTLNEIFGEKKHDSVGLRRIVSIYKRLYPILSAGDYQFMHQYAKGLLYLAKKLDDEEQSEKALQESSQRAFIAKSVVEGRIEDSGNYKLKISLSHILFTIAFIRCTVCQKHGYQKSEENLDCLHSIAEFFESEYELSSKDFKFKTYDVDEFRGFLKHCLTEPTAGVESESLREIERTLNLVNAYAASHDKSSRSPW